MTRSSHTNETNSWWARLSSTQIACNYIRRRPYPCCISRIFFSPADAYDWVNKKKIRKQSHPQTLCQVGWSCAKMWRL